MIFNQLEFLFLFLPIVTAIFIAVPQYRHWMLILASFIFYAVSGVDHAGILLFVSVWTWLLCADGRITGNKWRLAAAIAPALLALLFYKYLGFIADALGLGRENGRAGFTLFDNLVLPAGISFFTFHLVAYAADRYSKTIATAPSLRDFLLFMSFFPHLVAGPILRFSDVKESLTGLSQFKVGPDTVSKFLGYAAVGLALKVLIADTLGAYIKILTGQIDSIGVIAAAYVVFGYSFQIYFDFFGYSLIAIGLGTLFGFNFPRNFDDPYKSLSIKDFWRRWHMTLSFWIRDYLYLSLGGNTRYIRNILIVFAVCGLWHGAGWNFVLWGLLHGILVCAFHYIQPWWDRLPRAVRAAATFTIVSLLWLFFLFDFEQLRRFLRAVTENGLAGAPVSAEMFVWLAAAALVCFVARIGPLLENRAEGHYIARNILLGALLFVSVIFFDRSDTFIYFRF